MNNKFKIQLLETIAALVTAAFGLVAALAWNEAIKELIAKFVSPGNELMGKFIYALLVTILAVIVTLLVAAALGKLKAAGEKSAKADAKKGNYKEVEQKKPKMPEVNNDVPKEYDDEPIENDIYVPKKKKVRKVPKEIDNDKTHIIDDDYEEIDNDVYVPKVKPKKKVSSKKKKEINNDVVKDDEEEVDNDVVKDTGKEIDNDAERPKKKRRGLFGRKRKTAAKKTEKKTTKSRGRKKKAAAEKKPAAKKKTKRRIFGRKKKAAKKE